MGLLTPRWAQQPDFQGAVQMPALGYDFSAVPQGYAQQPVQPQPPQAPLQPPPPSAAQPQMKKPSIWEHVLYGSNGVRDRQQWGYQQQANQLQLSTSQAQFARQQEEWRRADQQRSALEDWVKTLSAEDQAAARANPEAAYEVFMKSRADATAPITPYQRAQLERDDQRIQASREEGAADRANSRFIADRNAASRGGRLRGSDINLMTSVREAADRATSLDMGGALFMEGNATENTGPISAINPLNIWDAERGGMKALSSQMRGYMRVPGSGATSDYEQRLYALGAPGVTNTREQNAAIVKNYGVLKELANARRFFYEDYADQNGSLNGAERAFQQSREYQSIVQANPLPHAAPTPSTAAPAPQNTSGRSFDTLPPPSGMKEGTRIRDDKSGRVFIIRNGRWAPEGNAGQSQREMTGGLR